MRNREQWMREYLVSRRHPVNSLIHSICVRPIVFSTIALAWLVQQGRK